MLRRFAQERVAVPPGQNQAAVLGRPAGGVDVDRRMGIVGGLRRERTELVVALEEQIVVRDLVMDRDVERSGREP